MTHKQPLTQYLRTSEIADYLKISTTWARILMKSGKIKSTFTGRYRATEADLLEYLNAENSVNHKTLIYLNKEPSDSARGHSAIEDEATNIINIHTDCDNPFIELLKSSTGTDAFELIAEVNK